MNYLLTAALLKSMTAGQCPTSTTSTDSSFCVTANQMNVGDAYGLQAPFFLGSSTRQEFRVFYATKNADTVI